MLTKFVLRNFKAHVDTDMDLKPITVFIGPNNSGKSSIFQVLLLYKQKALERNDKSSSLYTGGISRTWTGDDFLRVHQNNLVDLGDDHLGLKNDLLSDTKVGINGDFTIKDKRANAAGFSSGSLWMWNSFDEHMNQNGVRFEPKLDNGSEFKLEWSRKNDMEREKEIPIPNSPISASFQYEGGVIKPFREHITAYTETISEKEEETYRILLHELLKSGHHLFSSLHFIYGIRGFELTTEPITNIGGERTEYLGLPQRSISLGNILLSNYEIKDRVSEWFDKILNIKLFAESKHGSNVIIKLKSNRNKLLINEGLGTQQMLHMFIPIALADQKDTLLIEEPEIHLHPKTQADLMNEFIKINKLENKQFIMSTHSEHIIYPLLSAISRGDLSKEDVAIFFFNKDEKGVNVKELEMDEKGRIKGGLPGFFEQDLEEMMGYLEN